MIFRSSHHYPYFTYLLKTKNYIKSNLKQKKIKYMYSLLRFIINTYHLHLQLITEDILFMADFFQSKCMKVKQKKIYNKIRNTFQNYQGMICISCLRGGAAFFLINIFV